MKRALVTGILGQDGSYLAELLSTKGYEVFGLAQFKVDVLPPYITALLEKGSLKIDYGDITDLGTVREAMQDVVPDEVYNFAAVSDLATAYANPGVTWNVNYYAVGKLVNEAVKANPRVRFFQASSSEIFSARGGSAFGGTNSFIARLCNEQTPATPSGPYAEAKYRADQDFIKGYRERYGYFLCSGILFNHESERRENRFVTKKIVEAFARNEVLSLGNLDAKRDWSHAEDIVAGAWSILNADAPDDFVLASGTLHTVRQFVEKAAAEFGVTLFWEGEGMNEVGKDQNGNLRVRIDPRYFRNENYIFGDISKARSVLGWGPVVNFDLLVQRMVRR